MTGELQTAFGNLLSVCDSLPDTTAEELRPWLDDLSRAIHEPHDMTKTTTTPDLGRVQVAIDKIWDGTQMLAQANGETLWGVHQGTTALKLMEEHAPILLDHICVQQQRIAALEAGLREVIDETDRLKKEERKAQHLSLQSFFGQHVESVDLTNRAADIARRALEGGE